VAWARSQQYPDPGSTSPDNQPIKAG
jgi:hypothetical protein